MKRKSLGEDIFGNEKKMLWLRVERSFKAFYGIDNPMLAIPYFWKHYMKKTYRIDSHFYFLLIIFYLTNKHRKEVFSNMKNIMNSYIQTSSIQNFADDYDFLDEKKLAVLLKKVLSVLRRKNKFYYANLYDVFLMVESFGFAKNLVSGCTLENILNEELKKYTFDKRNLSNYIEERNFELFYLKREKRNLRFYLQHAEKRGLK